MDISLNLINDNLINNNNADLIFSNQLLNRFINYTDVNNTTIKGYKVCIRQFFNYLLDNSIKQPNRQDIKNYKAYISKSNFTSGTKQQYLRAVKHLFKWLASENLYPNIADNIKGFKVNNDNTKRESFTEDDIKTILSKIDKSTIQGKRDYAIILLALTGGLRVSEISNIDIQDIQTIKNQNVVYIKGKGRTDKDEYIKVIPEVYNAIKDYLISKPTIKNNDPLFTSTSNRALNKRITSESLSYIIKCRFKDAGYDSKKLVFHSLRHSSNTLLFKSGADLYQVQQHARHKDPKTTEIYLHSVNRDADTSEQDIYNQIFNTESQKTNTELKTIITKLTPAEQIQVLNYIKNIARTN